MAREGADVAINYSRRAKEAEESGRTVRETVAAMKDIAEKVDARERLTFDDGNEQLEVGEPFDRAQGEFAVASEPQAPCAGDAVRCLIPE